MRTLLLMIGAACLLTGCGKKAKESADNNTGGGGNTNFVPGGGAVQNVRKAGVRTISLADMRSLGQSVFQTVQLDDRMPSAAEIKQSMQREAPNVFAAINEGSIILTDTKNKTGLWAYEVDADTKGGIVLVSGTASRATADEVKQYLANK
jgi:hypothetical protein